MVADHQVSQHQNGVGRVQKGLSWARMSIKADSGIKKRLGVDHVNTASVLAIGNGGGRLQLCGHAKMRTSGNRSDRYCKPSSTPASRRDTLALRQQYQWAYLSRAGSWLRGEGSAL